MFPYKTSIQLDKNQKDPLYLQLANQIITLINQGKLTPGTRLVSSRQLADLLNIHRKTVVASYEELALQGWVESIPKKGTFIHTNLPVLHQQNFRDEELSVLNESSNFSFYKNDVLQSKGVERKENWIYINDGTSDGRLTPVGDIARIYRRVVAKKDIYKQLDYGSTYGNNYLRETLVSYLNSTRGLKITKENILITRGSQMGMWLSAELLLKKRDAIIVGETNYSSADTTFLNTKATLKRVAVDACGLITQQIEELCKKQPIKAVYVTSHHHHPTTVTLSAERRIHLLNLAKQYNFAIIEDDYDYDFNYNHAPILPLASHDTCGNVIYVGSICKTVAPVFRIGYLIASKDFIEEAAKLRGYVDRQGDTLLEMTFANFIKSGDLDRHIRKVMRIYEQRRNLFCHLLKEELSDIFQFETPKGGMAVWVTLDKKYSWKQLQLEARKYQLEIGDYTRYDLAKINHNSIRIGFASYTEDEIYELIDRLKKTIKSITS